MGIEQEILELVFRVAGEAEGKKVEKLLDDQKAKVAALEAELGRLDAASNKAGRGVAGFGQSALQSGRIVQDFAQGGIAGILNNIEGMTQALGLGSGLAGVLTIVGVGFFLLKPQIKEFVESLGTSGVKDFTSQLDTLGARIKEIEEKPHRLTVDVQELETARLVLDEIKAALGEIDQLRKSQAHYEKEAGAGVAEAIAEAPGGGRGVHQRGRGLMQGEVLARAIKPFADEAKATEAAIADAERDAANLAAAGQGGAAAVVRGTIEGLKRDLEKLGEARLAAIEDVLKPKGQLDQAVAGVIHAAKAGSGPEQAAAIAKLAALGVKADTAEELKAGDEDVAAQERFGERAAAGGAARRRKAGIKARAAAAFEKEVAETKQTPEYKERREWLRRRGELDQFGRTSDNEGFDARGAKEVQRKALALKAAPQPGKLPPMVDEAAVRKATIERRAEQVFRQSRAITGAQFTPEQARSVAEESAKLQGQGLDANQATMLAMREALQAMHALHARVAQQQAAAQQLGNGFRQVAGQAREHQHAAQGWGGG